MQNISKELSNKFASMALFCAMLVVFIHLPKPEELGATIIFTYLSRGIAKIAVPFFFVSAGFFLAGKFSEDGWYKREVVKRIKSLLIPLLIWNVCWFLFDSFINMFANIAYGRSVLENVHLCLSTGDLLRISSIWPFSQPKLGVLWFVRVLFILVVMSPLLRKMSNLPCIIGLFILHGLIHPDYGVKCTPIIFTFQEGLLSIFGVVYFCLGIYLRQNIRYLSLSRRGGGVILTLIAVVLLTIRGCPYNNSMYSRIITWLMTPVMLASVWYLMPSVDLPKFFSSMSFPIYTCHMFAISLLGGILKPQNSAFAYASFGVIAILASILFASLLRAIAPRFAKVIWGGR